MALHITAKEADCQGYANCLVTAPDYFDLSDEGKVVVLVDTPTEADELVVREAVGSCPVRALKLGEVT